MFSSWIMNVFQPGSFTKSTPSAMVQAGVGALSAPKSRSMNLP